MTPQEPEAYLAKQAEMSARIARKTARAKIIASSFGRTQAPGTRLLELKILNSLVRLGVAPTNRPKSAAAGKRSTPR